MNFKLTWWRVSGLILVLVLLAVATATVFHFRISQQELARYTFARLSEIFSTQQSEYLYLFGSGFVLAGLIIKRYWLTAGCVVLIACGWVVYYESVSAWLMGLGADSFSEAQNFDLHEALFFIPGLMSIFVPFIAYRRLVFYVLTGLVLFLACVLIRRKFNLSQRVCVTFCFLTGSSLITTALYLLDARTTMSYQSNSELFKSAAANFDNQPQPMRFTRPLNIVVYIGESTSVMNMGLYGYPRDTTPGLTQLARQDTNLLVFKNVMSTFTHTSGSLLESLSIGLQTNQDLLPITSRKRLGLPALLQFNHIPTYLLSNQGEEGTWNMAGSIIFKHSDKLYSVNTSHLGNAEYIVGRPYDGDFFLKNVDPLLSKQNDLNSSVIFLHSFAGHGGMKGYLGAIPESFHSSVDDYLKTKTPTAISGPIRRVIENIDNYDSAVRYVDNNVSQVIDKIRHAGQPTVLLYFSDHGESVFSSRGHESSRFTHEMSRVPFLMYFNARARERYPELFKRYQELSKTDSLSTLAQLTSTIIDLLAGQVSDVSYPLPPVIGSMPGTYIAPVLVRTTSSGDTYVNTNNADLTSGSERTSAMPANATDDPTRIFVARQTHLLKTTSLCYSDVNTLGMALRGALVSNCLQIDLVADARAGLAVRQTSSSEPALPLADILDIAARSRMALWLKISDVTQSFPCNELSHIAQSALQSDRKILISVKADLTVPDQGFNLCLTMLARQGIALAYDLSPQILLPCGAARTEQFSSKQAGDFPDIADCKPLSTTISQVTQTGFFSDLTFDVEGLPAVENLEAAKLFKWDVSRVEPRTLTQLADETFRMIGLNAHDLNALNK